jgi:sodium/hydrogen exchanger 8
MSFQPSFLELLAFGSLVSATDPVSTLAVFSAKKVDPQLFYLVFGESVINDAVGLVLFEAVAHVIEVQNVQYLNVGEEILQFLCDFLLNFFGSLVLGFFFGVAVAYFLKRVDLRSTPVWELCIYATIMYFPFVLAEICRVSGIVTVLFTGICARRYAEPNLSEKGAENADAVFRLTAHMTETFIFLELGMSVFDLFGYGGSFNAAFIAFALIACLIGRAVNIYPITFFYNLAVEEDEDEAPQQTVSQDDGLFLEGETPISDEVIPWNTAHMLWFSGLRGAVSYALVRTFPNTGNEATFIVTTMFIVLATTFILGGGTETALKFLEIPTGKVNFDSGFCSSQISNQFHDWLSPGIDEKEYIESLKKRKLLGRWFRRFELLRLRRWVLRDYEEESKADADAADYQEHVEVTEEEHIELVEREREQALYDFGQ